MNSPGAPPAIHRLIAALLLSPPALDRLGYLVDAGVAEQARRNGGAPSQHSLALQALIAEARDDAKRMSRATRGDIESDLDVTPSGAMSTKQAAAILQLSQRQVQRRAPELGGRLICGTWVLDRTRVEAAARE